MRRPARRYQLPPLVSHPLDDAWSVVVPIARTNLVTNPSFETNMTGWTVTTTALGTFAGSATRQRRGLNSGQMTPDSLSTSSIEGAYYEIALTAGTTYAYSLDFWGVPGVVYRIFIGTTGGVALVTKEFTATGFWQRPTLIYTETSTTTRRLYVRKVTTTNRGAFFIDGVQLEACETGNYFATTYIDGDQIGFVPNQNPPAYVWNGVPHASTSSRSGQTRAGGRVRTFKEFGWTPTAIIGLGLAPPQNQMTDYAALDGGQDIGTRKPARQFTLAGQFNGRTYRHTRDLRGSLAALLDRDFSGEDQRLKLLYQAMDGCKEVGEPAEIIAKYQGGLEGNTDGHFGSAAPISFVQATPAILAGGDAGVTLDTRDGITDADLIVYRSPAGQWSALGSGIVGTDVHAVCDAPELGGVLVGGSFTDAGGSGADNLALWANGAWSVVGSATAINGRVRAIVRANDGTYLIAGEFTNAGGVAAADFIVRWDGSSYTAVGASGANNTIYALALAPNGDLYAGGAFTDIGGSGADYLARFDGTAWNTVSSATALNLDVYALAIDASGNVYVGGDFTNAGGVADADRIAKWNGTTYAALSTGMNVFVDALAIGKNGILYAGGNFTTAGGLSISYIAQWNGVTWSAVGSGVNNQVNSLAIAPDGTLWASGTFTTAGGITVLDGLARWNGSAWILPGINLPGSPTVYVVRPLANGAVYVGFNTTGTGSGVGLTTITNPGTARSYPTLLFTGPVSTVTDVHQVENASTGRALYFDLTLQIGERVVMCFEPDNLSFVSNFQGNVAHTILPGSDVADFFVQPGTNEIFAFTTNTIGGAALYWRPAYTSLDDL